MRELVELRAVHRKVYLLHTLVGILYYGDFNGGQDGSTGGSMFLVLGLTWGRLSWSRCV